MLSHFDCTHYKGMHTLSCRFVSLPFSNTLWPTDARVWAHDAKLWGTIYKSRSGQDVGGHDHCGTRRWACIRCCGNMVCWRWFVVESPPPRTHRHSFWFSHMIDSQLWIEFPWRNLNFCFRPGGGILDSFAWLLVCLHHHIAVELHYYRY